MAIFDDNSGGDLWIQVLGITGPPVVQDWTIERMATEQAGESYKGEDQADPKPPLAGEKLAKG